MENINSNPIEAVLDQMLAEKEAQEAEEVRNAPPLTPDQIVRERAFYKDWTRNGRKLINCYGGNSWGISRQRCLVIRPAAFAQLSAAGILRKAGIHYQFIADDEGR